MDVNGWSDIGYNFVVGEDGLVYEGRGWSTVGAHAPNFNSNSIGKKHCVDILILLLLS